MKKVLLIIFILSAFTTNMIAQSDSIEIIKTVFGMQYYKDNKQISKLNVISMLKSNPKSLELYDKGVMNCTFGNISGLIGGLLVGYEINRVLQLTPNTSPFTGILGIGMCIASVPLTITGRRQKILSIRKYNSTIKPKVTYNLLFNPRGVGFLVKF